MENSSIQTVLASKFLNLINKWSLYLVILVWPFGHLLKIGGIYLLDIATFLLFITYFFGSKKQPKSLKKLLKTLYIFWFTLLISIFYNYKVRGNQDLSINFLYYLRAMVYPYLAFSYFKNESKDLKNTIKTSLFIFFFLCLLQYLFLPDLRIFKNLGFDDHYYRLTGPLLDPNFAGAIFASLAIYFLIKKESLLAFISIAFLAPTFSRASYLSLFISLLVLVFKSSKRNHLILVPILMVAIYFSPKPFGEGVNLFRTYSIESRIQSSKNGLSIFNNSPLLGSGFGKLTNQTHQEIRVDNSYIYLLASAGILGFSTLVLVLLNIFHLTKVSTSISLFPILIHSLFNNSFFYIWTMAMFWIIVGICLTESKSA